MLASILRATARNPVAFLSGTNLTNQTSDASRSLTLNTGFAAGDMLVAMTGNRTATPPTLLSDYTSIVSDGIASPATRSFRVQYKFATSTSETITWTGAYGFLVSLRNSYSVGKTNTVALTSAAAGTISLPDLTDLDVSMNSYVLAGMYVSSGRTSVSSPYALISDYAADISKNTNSSLTSKTMSTTSSTNVWLSFAIEFLAW